MSVGCRLSVQQRGLLLPTVCLVYERDVSVSGLMCKTGWTAGLAWVQNHSAAVGSLGGRGIRSSGTPRHAALIGGLDDGSRHEMVDIRPAEAGDRKQLSAWSMNATCQEHATDVPRANLLLLEAHGPSP